MLSPTKIQQNRNLISSVLITSLTTFTPFHAIAQDNELTLLRELVAIELKREQTRVPEEPESLVRIEPLSSDYEFERQLLPDFESLNELTKLESDNEDEEIEKRARR